MTCLRLEKEVSINAMIRHLQFLALRFEDLRMADTE